MAIQSGHNILNYNRRIHSFFGVLSLLQSEAKFHRLCGLGLESRQALKESRQKGVLSLFSLPGKH